MSFDFDRDLLDEISDAIVAKTQAGRVLYWNRGATAVFGYSRDEAVGRLVSELIIPEDRLEEENRILQEVLVAELSQYETMRRRKDGSLIYVDVSSRAVCDDQGKVNFILSSNKDVTRLKVERDAKLAEARYAKLLESTPDGIIMANPAGRIVLANSQAEKLFGHAPGELRGRSTEILLPSRLRDASREEKSALLFLRPSARGATARLELSGQRKDGTEFPIEISLSPLEMEDGTLTISAIRDASARRKVEKALRDQAVILDLINDSVVLRDLKDRITYWNQGAQRVYGWSNQEVLGRISHDVLKTSFPRPLEEIRSILLAQGHWEGELVHTRRDGSRLTVASRWTLQRDADGHPVAIIELNYDITERKRFEQALHEKNVELLASAESKNRFLANMSHELRTPLNGIIGFAEFLTDGKPGPLNPKQKEYLADILNSGRHLLQLINDVLDLAKVEANRMELSPEPFSPAQVIEGVCAVARPLAQKKDLQLTVEVTPGLDEVFLDQQKFKQILYNLISNAVKFTGQGGQVAIRARPRDSAHFRLEVQDTGIGIRREDLPRLFKEFEQLESGAGRRYEGTGLGLALTRRIVELQGGSIEVKSEAGKGSTFTVVLPRRAKKETT
jgi:protein-histidine pros-kinase